MDFLPKNIRYIDGAFWLVKLRWLFIALLVIAAFCAGYFFYLPIEKSAMYYIAAGLAIENIISYLLLRYAKKNNVKDITGFVTRNINLQISADLILLIAIIHFSGGIENPVYIFLFFHIVISSILLPRLYSYLQTGFAVLLLWAMAGLEYSGIIEHYSLWLQRSQTIKLYDDLSYITGLLTIFTIASFMLVYMANYIVGLLRKQERAYRKANILLEQQDKIKDEYILRVTHNIKGHLAVIQTNLAVINDKMLGPVEPRQLEFVEGAYNRSIKLTEFVNELLKLTQMRLDDKFEIVTFSLKELALNVFEAEKKNAERKKIEMKCSIDERIDKITSNPLPVEEIILNLLQNAIKYTKENGVVELIIADEKDKVKIQVSDTGIGIPANELPKLFTEFFRASNAKSVIKDGNGLGLAMVKYIAQRYGGNVSAVSEEGKGSVFTVILPKLFQAAKSKRKN